MTNRRLSRLHRRGLHSEKSAYPALRRRVDKAPMIYYDDNIRSKTERTIDMKIEIDSNNMIFVRGHVSRLNTYADGKAANIIVAVHRPDSDNDSFINLKCFSKPMFENLSVGMAVEIYGTIGPSSWKDKNGETHYKDNNDLIATHIVYNETKKVTMQRKVLEAYE